MLSSPSRLAVVATVAAHGLAIALVGLAAGCAGSGVSPSAETDTDFFARSDPDQDYWYGKVAAWQEKARRDHIEDIEGRPGVQTARRSGRLREKMGAFEIGARRDIARRVNDWAQVQARKHYRFDAGEGSDADGDRWPTLKELLENNGDDCDGLDLVAYQLLREFGFPEEQLYRAIVRRDRDRANHMVTLWFETRSDPWILDATGAMSRKMRRYSELSGWTMTKVFNETEQFSVVERQGSYALVPAQ